MIIPALIRSSISDFFCMNSFCINGDTSRTFILLLFITPIRRSSSLYTFTPISSFPAISSLLHTNPRSM